MPPSFRKVNPADIAVMFIALKSSELPLYVTNDYAEQNFAQQISQIPGVAQVQIFGQQKFAVRVQVDPEKAAARNLTLDEIGRRRAISASSSTASVLHADVIADRANLPGMYPHAVPSYASRGRLSSSGRSARHVPSPRNICESDRTTADGPVLLSAEEQRRRAADLWAALPIGLGLDDYEEGDIDNDVGDAEAHTTAVLDEWRSTMGGYFNNEDDDADDEDAGRADRENTPDELY